MVYRQVFKVLQFLQLEPSLDALRLRSDVISSIKILSIVRGGKHRVLNGRVDAEWLCGPWITHV